MDKIDNEILKILKLDSRTKFVEIAKIVGLSEGAVRIRVKKMVENKVIRKFSIETKSDVEAIILVRTDPAKTGEVATKIKEFVDRVFELSGDYDVAALIQTHTIEELNKKVDKIRNLAAVTNTNTLVKLLSD